MNRYKIKLDGLTDQNITISIKGSGNLLGYDDDVLSLVEDQTVDSINNVSDAEVRRFVPAADYSIQFQFWNGFSYVTSVAPLEFAPTDYTTAAAKNSFYVIQVFNSYRDEVNTKLHTGYFNGYDFTKTSLFSSYQYTSSMEFSNLYLPQEFLESLTGNTVYVKMLFYSAKSGKFYSFTNDNIGVTTQEKMYQAFTLDPVNMTYTLSPTPMVFKELLNSAYDQFINDPTASFNIEKTNYPSGNTFTIDGNYITT